MTILITGANGQLGRAIADTLRQHNVAFIALPKHELDISSLEAAVQTLNLVHPTVIINCAAYTAVDKAEQEPALCHLINQRGVDNLAKYCKKNHVLLVHFSTDFVFDGKKNTAYTEQDTPNPLNVYGKSKLAGERAIINSGCSYYIIRTSWLYGDLGQNFKTTMLKLARLATPVKVVADQKGTPTLVNNLAKVVYHIVSKIASPSALPCGLYHYSDDITMSWYELAIAIFRQENIVIETIPILSSQFNSMAKRPAYSALNSFRLKQWLEYTDKKS